MDETFGVLQKLHWIAPPILALALLALIRRSRRDALARRVQAPARRPERAAGARGRPSRLLTDIPFFAPLLAVLSLALGGGHRAIAFLAWLLIVGGFGCGVTVALLGRRWQVTPGQRVIAAVGAVWAAACAIPCYFFTLLMFGPRC